MWYKNIRFKHWMMYKDYEEDFQYGIDENKNWYIGDLTDLNNCEYLASDEEIEKGLRKEAKRRGFIEGTKFLGCEGNQKNEELVIDKIKFHTYFQGLHCENSWIFVRGQWGTVVEEQKEEFNVLNRIIDEPLSSTSLNGSEWDTNRILTLSGDSSIWKGSGQNLEYCILRTYFYYKSEKHGANFYELIKEIQTKVGEEWKTFVIYKQLGSGLEFSREKEEFYNKFKQVYV